MKKFTKAERHEIYKRAKDIYDQENNMCLCIKDAIEEIYNMRIGAISDEYGMYLFEQLKEFEKLFYYLKENKIIREDIYNTYEECIQESEIWFQHSTNRLPYFDLLIEWSKPKNK